MKDYLKQYDMNRFQTGEENSYRDLYNVSQRIIDEGLLAGNSKALNPESKGRGKAAPGKGGEKRKKGPTKDPTLKLEQGDCRAWCLYRKCPRAGECQFVHDTTKKGKVSKPEVRSDDDK
jgi:hypothetical protein